MDSLDLRNAPPREPRAAAGGIVFLPRTIDKVRATLPGGELGEYTIAGITQLMLDALGITLDDLTRVVAAAESDDDVAAFVVAHAKIGSIAAWNAFLAERRPLGGDRAGAILRYPWLADRPDLPLVLDVLAEDDRRSFSAR